MRRAILFGNENPQRRGGRQRREKLPPTPRKASGSKETRTRLQNSSLAKAVSKVSSLTRTRSESDLIRAIAKHNQSRREEPDSDDESTDSQYEDDSRRAASLRSFTKEDEERYARSCRDSGIRPGALCSKIGEEDEGSEAPEPDTKGSSSIDSSSSVSGSAALPETQTSKSPVSGSDEYSHTPETNRHVVSVSKGEVTKTSAGSRSGESTSATMVSEEVDIEYLEHENNLLKSSLKDVSSERDSLAQENWYLRVELENMRNQMRFMSVSSPVYTTGFHRTFSGMYETNTGSDEQSYCTSQTFEELLGG